MNKSTRTASALIALLVTGSLAGTVSAQTAAEATGISEEQAVAIALAEVPGEVLEVELETEDGMTIYEVEIAAESGEFEVEIDAQSGEILLAEAETDDEDDDDDDDGEDDDDNDDDDDDDKKKG